MFLIEKARSRSPAALPRAVEARQAVAVERRRLPSSPPVARHLFMPEQQDGKDGHRGQQPQAMEQMHYQRGIDQAESDQKDNDAAVTEEALAPAQEGGAPPPVFQPMLVLGA